MAETQTSPSTDQITFNWILDATDPHIHEVDAVIHERGWTPLNDATARVLCAFDRGRVVGFIVLQMFPHCEPLWVDPAYRGTDLADDLAARMLEFMISIGARGFMVIADSPYAAKLCEKNGMKKVTSPVYIR